MLILSGQAPVKVARWTTFSAVLLLSVVADLSASTAASAQSEPPSSVEAEAPASPPADAESDATAAQDEQARQLFLRAKDAYDGGRYQEALRGFEASLALSGRSQLFYNIGLVHDRMRNDDRAVQAYQQFLDDVPDSPMRAEVQARLASIQGNLENREREDAVRQAELERAQQDAAEAAARPAVIREEGSDLPLWIGIGAGVVAVAATIIIIVAVSSGSEPEYAQGDFGSVTFALGGGQ